MERDGFLQCASARADASTATATLNFILSYSENAGEIVKSWAEQRAEGHALQGVGNLDCLVTNPLPLTRMTAIIYVPS